MRVLIYCHCTFFILLFPFSGIHVDCSPSVPSLTTSYAHGTSSTSLQYNTVTQCLQRTVERFPDREAVVFVENGIRKTFAKFQQDVSICVLNIRQIRINVVSTTATACFWPRHIRRWIKPQLGCWPSDWNKETGSACGDPTLTSGSWSSSPQPKLELFWWVKVSA